MTRLALALSCLAAAGLVHAFAPPGGFDHSYEVYAEALHHVRTPLVDYAALQANRPVLDRAVTLFASADASEEPAWTREQRMAFWINAYNALTLRAIVDHYPIRSRWFTWQPRNSIRQIDGVWTDMTWRVAGRTATLDDIEHGILRAVFKDARVHFALNCASISCPPLAAQPYRPETLDAQLDAAARAYLASPEGLRVDGETLRVSSIFKWYGGDFTGRYAPLAPAAAPTADRAILGVIITYGPPAAVQLARSGRARITFLPYNWRLNEIA